jgi:predicted ATP-dependent protease
MNEFLQNFVESLREELKQYGELLALLEQQQAQVVRRLADELLETVSAVNAQGDAIQMARREREQRQRDLARSLRLLDDARIADLIIAMPEVYRPLVAALVDENNQLLGRVRQRARQNHVLLSRSVELMQQFINSFCAVGVPTYNEMGTMTPPPALGRPIYEAVG